MGGILQVRVSAWTFDEKEVSKRWPSLASLVWEDGTFITPARGVMELAEAVQTACHAELIDKKKVEALEDKAKTAHDTLQKLRASLADWQPQEADKLTYALEDNLDALEDIAAKF
ncbi:hypothetical protein [Desulfovibrio oxyclinae]|uniref:hypothetical protein n=1 Tax=Desulfovibrio oxyclinae TaxID=63560 RepID=UPI0003781380|nr:hypothetical protein [Desulfovibrio oxyclinae]